MPAVEYRDDRSALPVACTALPRGVERNIQPQHGTGTRQRDTVRLAANDAAAEGNDLGRPARPGTHHQRLLLAPPKAGLAFPPEDGRDVGAGRGDNPLIEIDETAPQPVGQHPANGRLPGTRQADEPDRLLRSE